MSSFEPTALPLAAEGIRLDAESVRAEIEEAPESHEISATDAVFLDLLPDHEINAAIRAAADDAFWEQYDGVRRRAIAQLARQLDGR